MKPLSYLLQLPFSWRQRRAARERPEIDESLFVSKFPCNTQFIARSLWFHLRKAGVYKELTPYPEDNLQYLYGLSDEDLDEDIILEMIEEFGGRIPSPELLCSFGPVRTPQDIVRLVHSSLG